LTAWPKNLRKDGKSPPQQRREWDMKRSGSFTTATRENRRKHRKVRFIACMAAGFRAVKAVRGGCEHCLVLGKVMPSQAKY